MTAATGGSAFWARALAVLALELLADVVGWLAFIVADGAGLTPGDLVIDVAAALPDAPEPDVIDLVQVIAVAVGLTLVRAFEPRPRFARALALVAATTLLVGLVLVALPDEPALDIAVRIAGVLVLAALVTAYGAPRPVA